MRTGKDRSAPIAGNRSRIRVKKSRVDRAPPAEHALCSLSDSAISVMLQVNSLSPQVRRKQEVKHKGRQKSGVGGHALATFPRAADLGERPENMQLDRSEMAVA